tara:strand:- start:1668 stop:1820 length:153 start_codon:yes stop_codon:yes gene_type:complete
MLPASKCTPLERLFSTLYEMRFDADDGGKHIHHRDARIEWSKEKHVAMTS